jgi:hypothetical protein
MNRINILADTNSLAHLSEIEQNVGNDSSRWLWDNFNVYKIKTIEEELERNIKKKRTKGFNRLTGRKYKKEAEAYNCKQIDAIESKIIAHYYNKTLGSDDRGERHLIGNAIAAVRTGKFDYCIILTDDYKAFTKFMEKVKQDFLFGDVWNVFDLIIYLFLIKNSITFHSASLALRTLIPLSSISAKKYKRNGMTDQDARIEMLDDYMKKLKQISILKTIL